MARVPAAKRSRPSESKSGSSTASRAKSDVNEDWRPSDQEAALVQGWGVFDCIDMHSLKHFLVIQHAGKRFGKVDPDKHARTFVLAQSNTGDALATRAIRAVFRSRIGSKGRVKK